MTLFHHISEFTAPMCMLFVDSIHHSEDLDRPRPPVCQRIGCQLYFDDTLIYL